MKKSRQVHKERERLLPGKGYRLPTQRRFDPVRGADVEVQCQSEVRQGLHLVRYGIEMSKGETVYHLNGAEVEDPDLEIPWIETGLELLEYWVPYIITKEAHVKVKFWILRGRKALQELKGK